MRTPSPRRVRFDAFTLDLSRCVLTRGDTEIPLRPKPFDMLRYLVEHPGRLLSKEELFETVWRGVTVGEDALVRCIRDVRDALGDRGRHIVKTTGTTSTRISMRLEPISLTRSLGILRERLWNAGERRFPHVRHKFDERQEVRSRRRSRA